MPLFLVTMASQNLPGFAVLRASGYQPPVQPALVVTGVGSVARWRPSAAMPSTGGHHGVDRDRAQTATRTRHKRWLMAWPYLVLYG